MKEKLQSIREEAIRQIQESDKLDKLNDVRIAFLGKKGELTTVLKSMKEVAPEDRPKVGQMVNETREAIESFLEETKQKLEKAARRMATGSTSRWWRRTAMWRSRPEAGRSFGGRAGPPTS